MMGFLHVVLMLLAFVRVLEFLRIYEAYFQLLGVAEHCLIRILPFTALLYVWFVVSSLIFRILGTTSNDEIKREYPIFGSFA